MNHQQTRDAIRLSLLMPDKRSDLHNVYCLRAKRQERETRAMLGYTGARGNVVNLGPARPPEPPRAA